MTWLFAAFAAVWIVFFGYALSLDRKQRAIERELAALSKKLRG